MVFRKKKHLIATLVVLLYLLFIISDEDTTIGPEELAAYRSELADFVAENIDNIRAEQTNRRYAIQEVCKKYGLNLKTPQQPVALKKLNLVDEEWMFLKRINWQYIYLSKPQSLIWCKVPKAGSSTWTYNFLKLAGQTTNSTKIHKLLRDYYPKQDSNTILRDNYKFMVVRHPFERILSAYRDKLEDISRDLEARDGYYHTTYGRHIVEDYRDKADRNLTKRVEPTWREFITYIINTPVTKFDEHWTPIWMLCSPCIIRYDVVAKMESFAEDTQFILEEAGLKDVLEVEWKHRTGTGGSSDLIMDYYSQLTVSEIAELFRKYQLDFELYGYNPEPYFEIAIQEP